jgi:Flp pilus assembly protein protease CpaA
VNTTFFWIPIIIIIATLAIAAYMDIKTRTVGVNLWVAMIISGIVAIGFYMEHVEFFFAGLILCVAWYVLNQFRVFGGADAWCMMLITLILPVTPISNFYFPGLFTVVVGLLVLIVFPTLHILKKKDVPFMVIALIGFVVSLGIELVVF